MGASQSASRRLQSMARRIEKSKRRLDAKVLERQIGRLPGRNARAAARCAIAIEDDELSNSGLSLKWQAHPEWDD